MSQGYDYSRHVEEDVRLIILRELAGEANGRSNDTVLTRVVEAFGHTKSRDWLRTQIRKLGELGGVRVTEAGTVLIVTLTRAGLDHVERRSVIEGVARPSLGV